MVSQEHWEIWNWKYKLGNSNLQHWLEYPQISWLSVPLGRHGYHLTGWGSDITQAHAELCYLWLLKGPVWEGGREGGRLQLQLTLYPLSQPPLQWHWKCSDVRPSLVSVFDWFVLGYCRNMEGEPRLCRYKRIILKYKQQFLFSGDHTLMKTYLWMSHSISANEKA